MKSVVIRQVKSLHVGCDKIGNVVLAKFACVGAADVTALVPATIVFWLLKHLPVNQRPDLQRPPAPPQIHQHDWDDGVTPRVGSVNCKQFADGLRMTLELARKTDIGLVLDAANVELLRQMLELYRHDLMDLDAA